MKKLLFVLLLSLSFACVVRAQEPAAHVEHAEAEAPESALSTVFRWANFAILCGGLGYLLRKPLREFLDGRRQEIADGLNRASRAQKDASDRMDEIEAKLGRLSADMAALRSDAEGESRQEHERLIAEARAEVDRVVEQAKQEIERVGRGVEREIKELVAEKVIDRASKTLRSEMTQDDHKRVVVRFIKNL